MEFFRNAIREFRNIIYPLRKKLLILKYRIQEMEEASVDPAMREIIKQRKAFRKKLEEESFQAQSTKS